MRTKVILGAMTAALLGLGVVLWELTREDAPVVDVPAHTTARTAAPDDPLAPGAPALTPKRDGKVALPPVAARTGDTRMPDRAPSPGPDLPAGPPADADYLPPTNRAIKILLRKQIDAIDGAVTECAGKTVKAGRPATGFASATFAIRRGATAGAPNIVDVAVEPIDTSVKDEALIDCFVATGKKIQLDLPDGVVEVTGTQRIDLDNGTITEHKLSAFDVKSPGSP